MAQRLQVLLAESEFAEIREIAERHRMTVAEWVRQALRAARREAPRYPVEQKLAVLREASQHAYPSGDIGSILADIERGRLGESS